jgi:hypothetical protein
MEAVSNRNVVMDCPVLRECKVCGIRAELLAIAAELENQ